MAVTRRHVYGLTRQELFDVLRDGRSYGDWVVGTRTIRDVDAGWPREGTCLHYTVGYGPLRHEDVTRSLSYAPDERLELEANAWPMGTVKVVLRAEETGGGVRLSVEEQPEQGIAARLHNPVLDLLIKLRNGETLRRWEAHARDLRR
jgi:hypothetical protein